MMQFTHRICSVWCKVHDSVYNVKDLDLSVLQSVHTHICVDLSL